MAKNKYLEKIVPFLEGELLEENKDEPKSYYMHTRQWFY